MSPHRLHPQFAPVATRLAAVTLATTMRPLLLVDNDPDDTRLFELANRRPELRLPVRHVQTATQAIEYLSSLSNPEPALVITALSLPGMEGLQLLSWIRAHNSQDHVPVIVLTGSDYPGDREKALGLGAAEFLNKPAGYSELVELLKGIKARWLSSGTKPPREEICTPD